MAGQVRPELGLDEGQYLARLVKAHQIRDGAGRQGMPGSYFRNRRRIGCAGAQEIGKGAAGGVGTVKDESQGIRSHILPASDVAPGNVRQQAVVIGHSAPPPL